MVSNLDSVGDFDLAIDAMRVSGPDNNDFGLLFRYIGPYSLDEFVIADNLQVFAVFEYTGDWKTIIDWTGTPAIQPGKANRLGISARGKHFTFSINGTPVAETENIAFSSGKVGIVAEMHNPGDSIILAYTNMELHGMLK